jgi:hypothetical protein
MVLCAAFLTRIKPFKKGYKMKNFLTAITLILVAQVAVAQSSTVSVGATGSTGTTAGPIEQSPTTSDLKLIGGIYSYNDFARQFEMVDSTPKLQNAGRVIKSKNELFLGLRNADGWGVQAMVVPYYFSWDSNPAAQKNSQIIQGDPSLSFMHPIYKSDNVTLTGKFREYFPVGDRSVNRSQWQQAYYLNLGMKLPNKVDLYNSLIPRYFSQAFYDAKDTTFYVEDVTTLTRSLASWVRVGLGQHTQIESHLVTPVGKTVELFPLADFMLSPTVFMGPRVYLPIYTQNSVYDAPRSAALESVQAELFFQATL